MLTLVLTAWRLTPYSCFKLKHKRVLLLAVRLKDALLSCFSNKRQNDFGLFFDVRFISIKKYRRAWFPERKQFHSAVSVQNLCSCTRCTVSAALLHQYPVFSFTHTSTHSQPASLSHWTFLQKMTVRPGQRSRVRCNFFS